MSRTKTIFDIGAVERETGLGKDTLRVWEKRYGFPVPQRDARGVRIYTAAQVERLGMIRRLLDSGQRPVNVVALPTAQLLKLLQQQSVQQAPAENPVLDALMQLLLAHDAPGLRLQLQRQLLALGLPEFLRTVIEPLNAGVGEAWMRGELRVFEEHLYSEQLTGVLRAVSASLRDEAGTPRILLTTLPGEEHGLGLLMAEAVLSLHGVYCIPLGVQTPVQEMVLAAAAHRADVVVLSCSLAMGNTQIKSGLQQARDALPAHIPLWAGGGGVMRLAGRGMPVLGVQRIGPLSELIEAVRIWRAEN